MTEQAKKAVLMVHLDPELKKQLALKAVEEGRSMSEIVRYAVATYIRVNRLQVQEVIDRFDEANRVNHVEGVTSGYADANHTMTYNLVSNEEA